MALCSLAFSTSAKRSCDFAAPRSPLNKRVCLSRIELNSPQKRYPRVSFDKLLPAQACYSSSSDSENDSDDQSCYKADQIRAKRRASSRVSFSLNNELSKAVSQYSDDDDNLYEPLDTKAVLQAGDDNIDCKLLSSPCTSSVYICNNNGNVQMSHHRNSSTGSFLHISDSNSSTASTKKCMPEADKNSRSRCFDYLVGAIDEAWARYCDVASYVEDETYGYNTPCSVATDDEEFGNTTDLTDYESDFEHVPKPSFGRKPSLMNPSSMTTMSADPALASTKDASCQLQELKDRLIRAKYFLQDLVDSDDYNDASDFWKRWDMIKYATIELVEDDDDDEVIEATIDDLEDGRLFTN
ncbi:CIC11C00000001165 [Sungouiella intermedia]|uniref:CIC11C00000001165 n=1 Tax=Sungouiella intermedia TaxID=45354 RepID=A0A1L0DQD7_9ASCO|nr:CIC11C00000001165 [[Candida] intermedia]